MIDRLGTVSVVIWGIIIVLFALFTDIDEGNLIPGTIPEPNDVAANYRFYLEVTFMIFIGFGFLYAFIGRYRYAGIAWTFWMASYIVPLSILLQGFWHNVYEGHAFDQKIPISIKVLLEGSVAAAPLLISFGAWMGKVSPGQMMFLATAETFFFALNFYIALELGLMDPGGTIVVHMFGAYFGLTSTMFLSPPESDEALEQLGHINSYAADGFSLLGAIFLWIFWPSFNAALASPLNQYRAIVNTVLSLCGSCTVTFLFSRMLRGKWALEDLQNATLAGGVAVGACCDLRITPGGALGIGSIAGAVGTLGYVYLTPYMASKFGVRDTAGINNLHGMPSIIGAIASMIAVSTPGRSGYTAEEFAATYVHADEATQARRQLGVTAITLVMSMVTGLVCGFIGSRRSIFTGPSRFFADDDYFQMPEAADDLAHDEHGKLMADEHDATEVPLLEQRSGSMEEEDDEDEVQAHGDQEGAVGANVGHMGADHDGGDGDGGDDEGGDDDDHVDDEEAVKM